MPERFLGQIQPEMDVCDINGDKIGTISHVYRHELAMAGESGAGGGQFPGEEILEVKTGFLGLGGKLYVPMSAIHDVTRGCVFLVKGRESIDSLDWDRKPDNLDELR
jgi:hypothetical protein